MGGEQCEFLVGVGAAALTRHQFKVGDSISGEVLPVNDPRLETVELYKVSKLKVLERSSKELVQPPPWHGVPPELAVYRQGGHRRLSAQAYQHKCSSSMWGCKMAVKMINDQWNSNERRYRTETFCYGPLSCPVYEAGPTRKVPDRRGMTYEEDWLDEDATSHRGLDPLATSRLNFPGRFSLLRQPLAAMLAMMSNSVLFTNYWRLRRGVPVKRFVEASLR